MSNAENGDSRSQEQLPDLYKLLGLAPLESDLTKIQRALLAMHKKFEAAEASNPSVAQRAARIVASGKKNLLNAERKSAYDRAWTKAFGLQSPAEDLAAARVPALKSTSEVLGTQPLEMDWDLEELESLLPAEDPRAAFDLGGFLRQSASMPESNLAGDYEKLRSFLGGTATAPIEAPKSISATELMRQPTSATEPDSFDSGESEHFEQFVATSIATATSPRIASASSIKQIQRKRNRAMLISVGSIAAVVAVAFVAMFYWVSQKPDTATEFAQSSQVKTENGQSLPKVDLSQPADSPEELIPVGGSGLPKVAGLDGEVVAKPNMMEAMDSVSSSPPATAPAQPVESPMSSPATNPAAMQPASPPAEPQPAEPQTAESQPTDVPPPDPELKPAEKLAWSKAMKETLKTLGMQNFNAATEQLAASEKLARTQLQREQHRRLSTIATLTEEFHGFLVDAVTGLGAAETFKVGRSLEASFIEGNEKEVSVKIRGQIQTFALTELQIGLAMGLVDLKMDTEHPTSLARKAAFALVHPKTNGLALKSAREQMVAAAAAGAVEPDMPDVFEENYLLK